MISSAKIKKGDTWPGNLPSLGVDFKFTKGLNVVYGPNGCGKSTLLRILAAYSCCKKEGGWSAPLEPGAWGRNDGDGNGWRDYSDIRGALQSQAPKGVKAKVDWDGTATFYHCAVESDAPMIAFDMPSDGLLSDMDRIMTLQRQSAGENRLIRLGRLFEVVKKPPDLTKFNAWKDYNDTWRRAESKFKKFVKGLPRKGPVTLLLDEPERSFDLPNQQALWAGLPRVGERLQVIIATHSPFALFAKANVIDMTPGYVEKSRRALQEAVSKTEK